MSERRIVQCRRSFKALVNGRPIVVTAGDPYYSDDPVVLEHERHFGELKVKSSVPTAPARAIETTSAAPGERRTVTRPTGRASGASTKGGKPDA